MNSFLSVAVAALALSPEFSAAQLSTVPKRIRATHVSPKNSEEWGRNHRTNVISSSGLTENGRQQRKLITVARNLQESMSMSLSYSMSMIAEIVDTADDGDSESSTSGVTPSVPEGSKPTESHPHEEEKVEISDGFPTMPPETAEKTNNDGSDESGTEEIEVDEESGKESDDEEVLDGEFVDQELYVYHISGI